MADSCNCEHSDHFDGGNHPHPYFASMEDGGGVFPHGEIPGVGTICNSCATAHGSLPANFRGNAIGAQADEPSHSTCDTCGTTEPMDDWHRFYGQCGACVQDVDPEHRPDQSDNRSAATALSHTLQSPPDRAGDPSRRPGY